MTICHYRLKVVQLNARHLDRDELEVLPDRLEELR